MTTRAFRSSRLEQPSRAAEAKSPAESLRDLEVPAQAGTTASKSRPDVARLVAVAAGLAGCTGQPRRTR